MNLKLLFNIHDTYNCDCLLHIAFHFYLPNPFSVKYRFPFPILHFWNHLVLLKDQFLKLLLKRANTCCCFCVCVWGGVCCFVFILFEIIGSNNSFTLNQKQFQVFKMHFAMGKCIQLWSYECSNKVKIWHGSVVFTWLFCKLSKYFDVLIP